MTSKERALVTYGLYEKARSQAGLSDYKVALMTNINPMCISDWKHGKYTPKADKLFKISKLLGIPFADFMGVTG